MNILKKQNNHRLLAKLMLIVMLVTVIFPLSSAYFQENHGKVFAAVPIDGLAIQAVRNNYSLHQGGKAVDGAYGNFGPYDAYILTKAGADLSTWEYNGTSFKVIVLNLIDATIANEGTENKSSAKRVSQEYLAAKEWGDARAEQLLDILKNRQTASGNGSFDSSMYGIYSNMPAFEALAQKGDLDELDITGVINYILGNQDPATKAWPIEDAPNWITNDLMTTAQAVRALEYLRPLAGGQTLAVQTAIETGKTWLQGKQQANGSFKNLTDDPLIDTAEVILTLDCLGIDPSTWVVGGKSAIDYMRDNALNGDGTFGSNGSDGNLADNTWALDAYGMLGGSVAGATVLAVAVSPSTASIEVGNNQQYTAQSYKVDGTTEDISATATWTVDDTAIATVNASGLVTGVVAGNAVVTATSQSVSGTVNVSVIVLYDERAKQAVRNNYSLHQGGKAVDGAYGNFGPYDAYILTKAGADLSTWEYNGTSFKVIVLNLIDATIANEGTENKSSAKRVSQEYLAAKEWGDARAEQLLDILKNRQTASGNGSFDSSMYGIYSNMPAFEALAQKGDLDELDITGVINYILGNQDPATKAWPIEDAPNWITNDLMTTAQAVRALEYLRPLAGGQTLAVQTAIETGKTWLQGKQQVNGSFKNLTDDPLIDTAEVILTLDCLGMSPTDWAVGGKSAIDFMRDNALNGDGTFGSNGSEGNLADNTWALDAYRILGGSVAGATALAVNVTPATATIVVGDTAQYTAHSYKMNGTTEDVSATATWTVNDTAKATVNASGLVTGVAAGNAVVTATSLGLSGTANVVVPGGGGVIIPPPAGTPIKVKVTGRSGETLYSLNTVYLQAGDRNSRGDEVGITPVGALDKTGLSYSYDTIDFMHTISGQSPMGMNGWMYKVNGVTMGVPAISYLRNPLNANDQVWWFYSTDSANIVGLDPLLLIPIVEVTGDDLISEALEKGQDIKINLEKRENMMVELGQESIRKLNEMQKEMNITNQGIDVTFTPTALYTEAVRKALDEGNATLQIGAKEVSTSEKEEILAKAKLGQSSGLFEIGGKLVDLTAQIVRESSEGNKVTEKINSFNEPVKVTLDLSNIHLSEEEIAQLTAVRYEKDAQGNIIPVKLGGTYNAKSKSFTFYTERFSYYGIVKAENLVKVSMGINMLTTRINGTRGYTDVPPILINDRTMVPLRFIAESLGATVQWLEESRSVKIKLGEKLLQLVVEETVPGLDTPPTIKGGRVLVPLRFVSETLGARVTWFSSTQRIEIVR